MKRTSLGFIFLFICTFMCMGNAYAGSSSITASSTSITTDGSVTIKVSASGLAGKFSVISSNTGVLSGGVSSVWLENSSVSYKFTPRAVGKATITLNPLDVADLSTNTKYTSIKSVTITVSKPREKSTNNDLNSITVEGYEITPVFNKDTLDYNVSVPADVEKVKVNASKSDSYSTLTGTGEFAVTFGENKFPLVVTSETGVAKTYNVIVTVVDNNPITTKIDGKTLTVVKRASLLVKPELFTEAPVVINDLNIPGFINEKNNIVLVGLMDENSKIGLYIYNSKDSTYAKYLSISNKTISFMSLSTDKKIDNYVKSEITIDDIKYSGYKVDKGSKYILIYGINLETGEKGWFSYNESDKTLQMFDFTIINNLVKENNKEINIYRIIIIALSFTIISLFTLLLFSKKKNNKKNLTVKKMKIKSLDTDNVE